MFDKEQIKVVLEDMYKVQGKLYRLYRKAISPVVRDLAAQTAEELDLAHRTIHSALEWCEEN